MLHPWLKISTCSVKKKRVWNLDVYFVLASESMFLVETKHICNRLAISNEGPLFGFNRVLGKQTKKRMP